MTTETDRKATPRTVATNVVATLTIVKGVLNGYQNKRMYLAPHLPEQKLENAIDAYATDVLPREVLLLYDDTVWEGCRDGLMITTRQVRYRNTSEDVDDLYFSV